MKRFHVHIAVKDLPASIAFYRKLFGQAPSIAKSDYAKWIMEDPGLNFAISSRRQAVGVNHFGMQVDSSEELASLKVLAEDASGGTTFGQGEVACCYANSEKHWTVDPQGLAWEHFQTMSDAVVFGDDVAAATSACCIPLHSSERPVREESCCVLWDPGTSEGQCCD